MSRRMPPRGGVLTREPTRESGKPRTVWESVGRRRFLLSGWPWRSLGYVLTTPPLAMAVGLPLATLILPWSIALQRITRRGLDQPLGGLARPLLLGAALIVLFGPLVALPLAEIERRRLRIIDTAPVESPHRTPPGPGLWSWLRTRYTEPPTWRALGYAFLLVSVLAVGYVAVLLLLLMIGAMTASPFLVRDGAPVALGFGQVATVGAAIPYALIGVALLPMTPYVVAMLAGGHGAVARVLLHGGRDARLRAELVEVSRSRARLVDAFEAERRRIERDLHDGAQQRLVTLTLQLGLARLDLPAGSPAAEALASAHTQAKQLMAELRELIRGIHPQVLTDLGLPAALHDLADNAGIPITVNVDLPGRLPSQLEGTAYFVVAEALTNIAKHSGATSAAVDLRLRGPTLIVEISDDGRGGADPRDGSGLTGLADRVAVIEGKMLLSSPVGGPTLLRVELPCSQHHRT